MTNQFYTQRINLFLQKPTDVYEIATIVASLSPNPGDVITGVYELLINAIEHGNLGIGFLRKNELVRQGKWQNEITRRLYMPGNAKKLVRIEVIRDENGCRFSITDEGKGFNWQQRLREDAEETRPHGRGLVIAMHAAFDSLEFNERGNAVTAHFRKAP